MKCRWTLPIGLSGILALSGCVVAPPPGPHVIAVPGQGKNQTDFQQDEVACRQYAAQQPGITPEDAATQSALGSAALSTLLGAALGAAIGAATGSAAAGAAIGAGGGLLVGSATGADAAAASGAGVQYRYDASYAQCMTSKGNSV